MPKPPTVRTTTNCEKLRKRWEHQTTRPVPREIYMQVRKQQLQLDTEQQTGPKQEKEHVKAVIPSPCLPNPHAEHTMRNAGPEEAQAGTKTAGKDTSNLRHADDTTPTAESEEEPKSPPKVKEESEKAGPKPNTQKTKITASSPITPRQTDGETMETVSDPTLRGSKITADGERSHEIKRRPLPGRKATTNPDSILKSRDTTLLIMILARSSG